MKIFTLILIFFLTASGTIFSQKAPKLAPLNPDFVSFMAQMKNGEFQQPGTEESRTGAMPPPCQVSFDNYLNKNNHKSTTFAPVYDMRTTGLLTPVKVQTANGCWAFATISSVESRWLVLGQGTWDLSENNLKYCHGFIPEVSYWGNHYMSTAYFARRHGALIEADDPNNGGSPGPGLCPTGKTPVAYITDSRYLPKDMNTVKQAILDYGAIYTMLYYSSIYYNAFNFTYYYGGTPRINHAVTLVGWDDTKVTAGGTGAWICKNSYGTGWGEAGFFYVSYYDTNILDYNAYWPVRCDNLPSSTIYGYDELGNCGDAGYGGTGYEGSVGYILVKFVASGKQLLSKVGTYAKAADETIEIDVFDNFDQGTKTLSGLLSHQAGLFCSMPGYYTFDLPAPLAVEQGNDFYIRVRYQTTEIAYQIPIEYAIEDYCNPEIASNVSWTSENGADGSWDLIGNSTSDFKWDPCVKVYAESLSTWNGNISNDWNNAANWSPGSVPASGINAIICNVAQKPVINQGPAAPAVCNKLTIEPGSSVTINPGKALTINGDLINNAGNTGIVVESGGSLLTRGIVNGQATVKRDIVGGAWHLISAPVSDAFSGVFSGNYLQQYSQSTNAYSDILSTNIPLTALKGFAVYGSSSFTTQYSGLLNTGVVGSAGNLTRSLSGANSGWNLVGNPYPSPIDWSSASGWAKTNLNDAIYIEKNGVWATYIAGVGTNAGTRYIAPGQGFFVQVKDGFSTGTLAMSNNVRVHDAVPFFKSSINNLIRLQVSGNGFTDEAVVRFLPEATSEFDGEYDAYKFFGDMDGAAQLYTAAASPLSINTIPETSTVPLGIRANSNGVFTIAATEINDLTYVSCEDKKTGEFTDLLKGPYSFSFIPGENEQRFVLHFSPLAVNEIENSFADIYSFSGAVYVNLNDNVRSDIYIYNITGQLIASKSSSQGSNSINVVNPGDYIVKVVSDKATMVKKVWVQ